MYTFVKLILTIMVIPTIGFGCWGVKFPRFG